MIAAYWSYVESVLGLGLEPKDLGFTHVSLRGVLVFFAALFMVRIGDKRFFARKAAFDVILAFILASVLARAVNGSSPLFPTIGAGFVLVLLHRALGFVSYHCDWFGTLIKGRSRTLIENGEMVEANLRKSHISRNDLLEDMRLHGSCREISHVEVACLERNGEISVIERSSGP